MKSKNIACFSVLILLFLGLSSNIYGQRKWFEKGVSVFNEGRIEIQSKASIEEYVNHDLSELGLGVLESRVIYFKTSKTAHHYLLELIYKGSVLYGGSYKLNIAKNGKILSLFKTVPTLPIHSKSWDSKNINIKESYIQKYVSITRNREIVSYLDESGNIFKAYKIQGFNIDSPNVLQEFVFGNNQLLTKSILNRFDRTIVPAKGYVFSPDPITSAKKSYEAPFVDAGDTTNASLDSQRYEVSFKVIKSTDTGVSVYLLESSYAKIRAFTGLVPIIKNLKPEMKWDRSQSGFEEVNAYYHINTFQEYIQSLGFMDLGNYQIQVDPHGDTQDNSSFTPDDKDTTNNLLNFGIGGVDDAEDADVIIHEYNHGISFMASGNTNYGVEREGLEEGTCDYFACGYSKAISTYRFERLYSWDGNNEFWQGRSCINKKLYTSGACRTDKYPCGEIWNGAAMDIQGEIGRESADALMLETEYSYSKNMTLHDAAVIWMQIDSILYLKQFRDASVQGFVGHQILKEGEYVGIEDFQSGYNKVTLNKAFFNHDGLLNVKFSFPQTGNIRLYNLEGKLMMNESFSRQENMNYYNPDLKSGIYVLEVLTSGNIFREKVVKE